MIKDLLNYQQTDAKLRKIEVELAGTPARKKMSSAKAFLVGVEENVNKLDDKASLLTADYEKIEQSRVKLEEQLEELKKAMSEAQDENEITYLAKKADELLATIKNLAVKLNKINEDFQEVIKEYAGIRSKTKAAQTQYAESKEEYEKQKSTYADEIKNLNAELEKIKKGVDDALMEKYLKKRQNKIFPVVVEVTSRVCRACGMELSMLELNKLANGEIIECEHCGRMLYQKTDK